jgi:hypothetical protein
MKSRKKISVAEKIIKVINKQPMNTDEVRRVLKDRLGYKETSKDVGINLLYLLRRGKIERIKVGKIYKYHI